MEKENNSVTEATKTKKKGCPKWLKAIGNAFASFGKWFAHTKRGIQLILVALCLFVIGLGSAASFVFLCPVIENGIAISKLSIHAQRGHGN